MTILAIDTATDILALGLSVKETEKRYYLEVAGGLKHSELIMDAIDTLLNIASIARKDLEAVACMEGPGSFTGLRIGFSAAKGISLALGIPVIPVPTLDCMAAPFLFWPGTVLPVIDAKKKSFFTALFRQDKRISDYLDLDMEALIKIIDNSPEHRKSADTSLLVTGPAVQLALPGLKAAFPHTVADNIRKRGYAAELLNIAAGKDIITSNHAAGPLYLRKSDAELNENAKKQNG